MTEEEKSGLKETEGDELAEIPLEKPKRFRQTWWRWITLTLACFAMVGRYLYSTYCIYIYIYILYIASPTTTNPIFSIFIFYTHTHSSLNHNFLSLINSPI